VLGRVITAWPSFALTASYELLMRQVRHAAHRAARVDAEAALAAGNAPVPLPPAGQAGPGLADASADAGPGGARRVVQRRAWQWAMANRRPDGSLPASAEVARQFGRSERWGRLVTGLGREGQLNTFGRDLT
jgi:hypothetical protein